jgi:AraC-like DNA-binding protein
VRCANQAYRDQVETGYNRVEADFQQGRMIDRMLPETAVKSSVPAIGYVRDLNRSGMKLFDWRERAGEPGNNECAAERSVYRSWSDGRMGVFGTYTGNSPVLIDAELSADVIAFSIPLSDAARTFKLSGQRIDDAKDLGILTLPAGSRLQITTGGSGLRSVTLMIRHELLHEMCAVSRWKIPPDMRAIFAERGAMLVERRLPAMLQQAATAIICGPCDEPFAPLFYHAKMVELLWLLLEHLRADCTPELRDTLSSAAREDVVRVRRFIDSDFMRSWNIETLSRIAGMNRTKLRKLFKRIYGTTIFEYRTAVLMRHADALLRDPDVPIAEISFRLGYNEPSSFNTAFKRFYGYTPGKRRRKRAS